MKSISNVLKTIILTGVITILSILPNTTVQAETMQPTQDKKIIGVYTESNKDFYCDKGDCITEYADGSFVINSDVEIQSISYLDNTVTVAKNNGELYSFYVDEPREYYLSEQINITMDQNNEIIDYIVDLEPQVYNTTIDSLQGNTAFLIANGNKYSFINEEGQDGWITGDKCKAVIQDGKLLEVRPIPLNER